LSNNRRFLKVYFWGSQKPTITNLVGANLSYLVLPKSYITFWNAIWVSSCQKSAVKSLNYNLPILLPLLGSEKLIWNSTSKTQTLFLRKVFTFCTFYKELILQNSLRLGQFLYYKHSTCSSHFDHKLYLTFSPSRFYVNFRSFTNLNYFSLSVGLFLKFFNNQKSLKKTKTFKFLLVKLLRKILVVSGIRHFMIFFKRAPILLAEVFRFLTSPLITPFHDPVQNRTIVEDDRQYVRFSFKYFFFLKTVSYTTMKGKQKGRLKRKISKKIIKRNNISDEA